MAKSKKERTKEILGDLYDKMWTQVEQDREIIHEMYNEFKSLTDGNPERLVVLGDNLTKSAELLMKQTSQVIEMIKIQEKKAESAESEGLTKQELDEIYQKVGSEHQ